MAVCHVSHNLVAVVVVVVAVAVVVVKDAACASPKKCPSLLLQSELNLGLVILTYVVKTARVLRRSSSQQNVDAGNSRSLMEEDTRTGRLLHSYTDSLQTRGFSGPMSGLGSVASLAFGVRYC